MATAKKLPSGNWRVNLFVGYDENKKRIYKSFTAPTKREAEFEAAKYNISPRKKANSDSEITFGQAVDSYIEMKRNILSPSTIRGYKVIQEKNLSPLNNLRLSEINQELIQRLINEVAANHAPKTCRNIHGLISSVLKMYGSNITLNTTFPQKSKKSIYVPDEEEVAYVYELAKGTINEIPVFLAAECGLRASEIAALEISNINSTYIEINQAKVRGEHNKNFIKPPKSISGNRKIPINENVYSYLIKHLGRANSFPRQPERISKNWARFRERNNLDDNFNFHALRHHYASKCLLMEIPQKYIAELMGHSSTAMIERVYQHTFPSAMEEYSKKIRDRMLG